MLCSDSPGLGEEGGCERRSHIFAAGLGRGSDGLGGSSRGLGTDGGDMDMYCQGESFLLRPCCEPEARLGLEFKPQKTDGQTDDR